MWHPVLQEAGIRGEDEEQKVRAKPSCTPAGSSEDPPKSGALASRTSSCRTCVPSLSPSLSTDHSNRLVDSGAAIHDAIPPCGSPMRPTAPARTRGRRARPERARPPARSCRRPRPCPTAAGNGPNARFCDQRPVIDVYSLSDTGLDPLVNGGAAGGDFERMAANPIWCIFPCRLNGHRGLEYSPKFAKARRQQLALCVPDVKPPFSSFARRWSPSVFFANSVRTAAARPQVLTVRSEDLVQLHRRAGLARVDDHDDS